MDDQRPTNLFREVHRQVKELRDRIREEQEGDMERREAKLKEEAKRQGGLSVSNPKSPTVFPPVL